MKSNLPPRLGMIDALGAGLEQAGRRPWLWIFPAIIDLILWVAPRLSIEQLGLRLINTWKALLPMAYSTAQIAAMQDVIGFAEQGVGEIGRQFNLLSVLAFGWLAPPSALAAWQPTRFTLFSDGVLAPLGLGVALQGITPPPLRPASIEIGSVWLVLLILLVVWLIGQVIVALFYRTAALGLRPVGDSLPKSDRIPRRDDPPAPRVAAAEQASPPGPGLLTLRVAAVSIIAAASAFVLTLPLGFVGLFAQLAGGGGAELLLAVGGGLTLWLMLWFLSALFFVGDLIVLDGAPLWRSLFQSLLFVRANGFRTMVFAAVINIIMLGARALWGIIGSVPLGALVAILLNSILATAMLLSIFVYYRSLRRYWQAVRAAGVTSR